MAIIESAIIYIIQNWVSIIFAIVLSSIFYILSSRGLKNVIVSRQDERLKIAKESIVDVLENQIINNSEININKIIHMLNATSRERGVNLTQEYAPTDLLEDLELRFEKSKHLKNEQRVEYSKKIEELIKIIDEEKAIIIPSYENVLKNLAEAIEREDNGSIKQNMDFLRSKLLTQKEKELPEGIDKIIAIIAILLGFLSAIWNKQIINTNSIIFIFVILFSGVALFLYFQRKSS